MLKEKGKDVAKWNWQVRLGRDLHTIEEEEEYVQNVEAISHKEYTAKKDDLNVFKSSDEDYAGDSSNMKESN